MGATVNVQVSLLPPGKYSAVEAVADSHRSIEETPSANKIQTSSEAIKFTKDFLAGCPTDRYLIVTQPGINAADFWTQDGCAMPHLCKAVKDARVKGKYTAAEVVGDVTSAGFVQHIKSSCNKKGKVVKINAQPLQSLSGDRSQALDTSGKCLDPIYVTRSWKKLSGN